MNKEQVLTQCYTLIDEMFFILNPQINCPEINISPSYGKTENVGEENGLLH